AGWDAVVKIWDPGKTEAVQTLRAHLSPVYTVVFSPDGRLLASPGSNDNLKIWEEVSNEVGWRVIQSVTGHPVPVLGLSFRPSGRRAAGADGAGRRGPGVPAEGQPAGVGDGGRHAADLGRGHGGAAGPALGGDERGIGQPGGARGLQPRRGSPRRPREKGQPS